MNQQSESPDFKSALGNELVRAHDRITRRRRISGVITIVYIIAMLGWITQSVIYLDNDASDAEIFWRGFFPLVVLTEAGMLLQTMFSDDDKKMKFIISNTLAIGAIAVVLWLFIAIVW